VTSLPNRRRVALAGSRDFVIRHRRATLPFAGVGLGLALFAAIAVAVGPAAVPSATPSAPSNPAIAAAASSAPAVTSAAPSALASLSSQQPGGSPAPAITPVAQLTGYVWPLAGANITLPFEATNWGEFLVGGQLFHDGVDMTTWCGDRIVAAHDSVVLAAGRHFDDYMGWQGSLADYYARLNSKHLWNYLPIVVVTDDGNGYRSIYAHMSVLTVKVGQHLKAGQLLGYEGMTGNATGCHLHYGLFNPNETFNFGLDPGVSSRMRLPGAETARVDPLLVLPYRNDVIEMRTLRPLDAAAWAAGARAELLVFPPPPPTPTPPPASSAPVKSTPKPTPKASASPKA
jgi:murein DD-endopeptidase MepM/ murein hydrolase activator NlpD